MATDLGDLQSRLLVYAAAAERARWRRLFLTRIEEVASMIAAVTAGTQRERKWRLAGPVARMMQADNKKYSRSPACMNGGAIPRSSRDHGAALGGRGLHR